MNLKVFGFYSALF